MNAQDLRVHKSDELVMMCITPMLSTDGLTRSSLAEAMASARILLIASKHLGRAVE